METIKPYTAAYVRVSSKNGRQKTDSQRHAIQAYIRANGLRRVEWFEDHATGRNVNRESLQRLIDDCRLGRCTKLIVYKIDRLARSCRDCLNLLHDVMGAGVTIVIVAQGMTLDNSLMSKAFVQLFSLIAEMESSHLSERTRAELEKARANGVKLGRTPNERKRSQLARWSELGVPIRVQAERLGGISRQAVYAMRKRAGLDNEPTGRRARKSAA